MQLSTLSILILGVLFIFFIEIKSVFATENPLIYKSIDTMKESRDTETFPLSPAQIAQSVNLAASLNTTHITVDTHWEYDSYMKLWIDAIRAAGKKVWFRGAPNQWENNNNTPGIMTPTAYVSTLRTFITSHPDFFQSGDIFDPGPEPENGKYWLSTYSPNWSWQPTAPNAATDEFNTFIVDSTIAAEESFAQIKVSGIKIVRSTNSWWASHPDSLYQSTTDSLGSVTADFYPAANSNDPVTVAQAHAGELNLIASLRSVPVIVGELGYSNELIVDDSTQQKVLKAVFAAIKPLNYIAGLNYWVAGGDEGVGGYTYIFSGGYGNWALRPAAHELANFFSNPTTAPSSDPTHTPISTSTPNPTVIATAIPTAIPTSIPTSLPTDLPTYPPEPEQPDTITPDLTPDIEASNATEADSETPEPTPDPTEIPVLGDPDGNGVVNIFDYTIILRDYGKVGIEIEGDLDGNGVVNSFDYNIVLRDYGKST